ncbi:hypothetical protein JKP88DRAFT_262389 [Tribonema minus]|uniref:Uncharacterized protein n=1 Tax=Tribonema minus TaxID=303371 RepID=A0A835ZD19_9STRA|nr:hypothetical protein JKP88DRAFT_262389 [Tribonema minus]
MVLPLNCPFACPLLSYSCGSLFATTTPGGRASVSPTVVLLLFRYVRCHAPVTRRSVQASALDIHIDMLSSLVDSSPRIEVDSLSMPRTDMGAAVTNAAMYLVGGCGLYSDPIRDGLLLVNDCKPSDLVDVFAPNWTAAARLPSARPLPMQSTQGFHLCEPKYAATTGVFWTGEPDQGMGGPWAQTPHVVVAGGIVSVGEGMYRATDTIDILREEGVTRAGKVSVTNLPVQRLPQPRFDMSSCCFKHICVFAGGQVNLDGYFSDRVDVWNGERWGWTSDHTLSEARFGMGTASLEMALADGVVHMVGFFAGGVGRAGNLFLVDLYDFASDRWLPRIYLPTVRGKCSGVTLGIDAAMFIADTGEVDVFNSTSLCWTSYKLDGIALGAVAAGRAPQWYFDPDATAGGGSGYYRSGGGAPEGLAYVAGGIWGAAHGLSSQLTELTLALMQSRCLALSAQMPVEKMPRKNVSPNAVPLPRIVRADAGACRDALSMPLAPVQMQCGAMGGGDVLGAFKNPLDVAPPPAKPVADPPVVPSAVPPHKDGSMWPSGLGPRTRVVVYLMIAALALLVSYMVSAAIILRRTEGIWRLPFGGGVLDALHRALAGACGGSWRAWQFVRGDRYAYESIRRSPSGSSTGSSSKDIEAVKQHGTTNTHQQVVITHAPLVQEYTATNGRDGRPATGVHRLGPLVEGGESDASIN